MDPVLPGLGSAILLGLALSGGSLSSLGHPTLALPVSNFSTCTHLAALAGQEACPGVCSTVQLPHECCCCSCFCCCGLCHLLVSPFRVGPFWIAWMALELPRPMASISPLIAMWVLQTSNILAVVSLMGKVRSFFTRSLSSRALTSRYCMFCSFSYSDGKLQ